ncbi:LuxR C-terminal-related transcriptional regulator [Sphingomonas aurantiaca]
MDDAAIAERLELSRNTVRNHVARLYAKIGVNRRSAAIVWAHERGVGA